MYEGFRPRAFFSEQLCDESIYERSKRRVLTRFAISIVRSCSTMFANESRSPEQRLRAKASSKDRLCQRLSMHCRAKVWLKRWGKASRPAAAGRLAFPHLFNQT